MSAWARLRFRSAPISVSCAFRSESSRAMSMLVFATASRIPDTIGEAGLGFQIGLGGGIELTGEYQAHVGDRFLSHTGTARLSARF